MSKDEVLFSEYKKSFNRYAEFFGVKNYEIFFLIDKDDAGRGRIEVNYQDKMANVCLCNGALVGNEKDIDKVAFHEAAELFCLSISRTILTTLTGWEIQKYPFLQRTA